MPHRPSVIHIDPEAATVARVERMLDLAEIVGVDPEALAYVRHRLVAHEDAREGMLPSLRRDELDRLIDEEIEELCLAYKRMERMVDRMPKA